MSNQLDAQAQIIAKALKDPNFKESLLSDPKAAIAKELGVDIPDSVNINVLEATDTNLYLVIPSSDSDNADGELSTEQLASVAGGAAPKEGSTICSWTRSGCC